MVKFQSLTALATTFLVISTPIAVMAHTGTAPQDFNVAQTYTQNIEGWNRTRWGMSIAEVQKIFTGLQPDSPTVNGEPRLVLKGFSLNSFTYDVSFAFGVNGLRAVNLEQVGGDAEVGFSLLLNDLKEKYGQPTSTNSLGAVKWILPSTEIILLRVNQILILSYIPKQARQEI